MPPDFSKARVITEDETFGGGVATMQQPKKKVPDFSRARVLPLQGVQPQAPSAVPPPAPMAQTQVMPPQMPKLEFEPVAPTSTGEVPFKAQAKPAIQEQGRSGVKKYVTGPAVQVGAGVVSGTMQMGTALGPGTLYQDAEGSAAVLDKKIGELQSIVTRSEQLIGSGRAPTEPPGIIESLFTPEKAIERQREMRKNPSAPSGKDAELLAKQKKELADLVKQREDVGKRVEKFKEINDRWQKASVSGWLEPPKDMSAPEWIARTVSAAVPSLATAAGASVVAGPMAGGLILGHVQGVDTYLESRKAGLPVDEANRLYITETTLATLLEKVPLEIITGGMKGSRVVRALTAGTAEGAQEVADQIKSNLIASGHYDKDRKWYDGLLESFVAGFGSGAVVGAFTPGGAKPTQTQNAPSAPSERPTESILSDLEASGEAERVTAQDLVNMGIPEAEAKSYMQNRIAQGKPTNISGIGQKGLVPQEAEAPVLEEIASLEQKPADTFTFNGEKWTSGSAVATALSKGMNVDLSVLSGEMLRDAGTVLSSVAMKLSDNDPRFDVISAAQDAIEKEKSARKSPAPVPAPPQAGIQAPPATVAGTSPSENAVTGTEDKGGVSIFTNDETGEQVSGTVLKETKENIVIQTADGVKKKLGKDQWAGEVAADSEDKQSPDIKTKRGTYGVRVEPLKGVPVGTKQDFINRNVGKLNSEMKKYDRERGIIGTINYDRAVRQLEDAYNEAVEIFGVQQSPSPVVKESLTGETATQTAAKVEEDEANIPYSRDLKITNLDQLPRGIGARYLEVIRGENGTLIAKRWRRSPAVREGVLLVDMEPSPRSDVPAKADRPVVEKEQKPPELMTPKEVAKIGAEKAATTIDRDKPDADGFYYHATHKWDGEPIISAAKRKMSVDEAVKRWPDYADYLESKDAQGVSLFGSFAEAQEFVDSFLSGQGEVLRVKISSAPSRNSEGYALVETVTPNEVIGRYIRDGDRYVFKREKESPAKEPWEMTQKEIADWNISMLENRGIKISEEERQKIYADKESHRIKVESSLSEGKPVPAEVLKDYPDLKPAPQDIEGEGKKEKKGGFLSLPGGVWANRLINSIKATIRESSERADAYFSKARQMDRADSIRQKQNAFRLELQAIRKRLVKAKFNDNDVFEDLNRTVGETEYVLGNETFAKDDLERMDVDELKVIAKQNKIKVPFTREQYLDAIKKGSYYDKANKIYRLGNDQYTLQQLNGMSDADLQQLASDKKLYPKRTRQDFVDAIIGAATFDRMTPAQFSRKYNLTASETKILVDLVTEAQSLSKDVESLTLGAGLEVSGDFIGQNDLYSRRKYLRNILGWKFKPTAGARTDALIAADEVISESVERIGTLATKLNKRSGGTSDVGMFLQTGNRQYLTGLDSESRQMAQNIKSMYDSFGDLVIAGISSNNGVVDIATHIDGIRQTSESLIEEMIHGQPTNKNNTGMGSVADALLHRQLDRIWRNLFGEIKDPAFRYAMSREAQMNTVNRMTFLNELASKSGLFSDTKIDGESLGHTVRLGSSQKMNATVSMSDRAKFGVLAGKYTSPEVAKIIAGENAFAGGDVVILGPLWSAAKRFGGVMRGNMILRPAALVRDALTGMWGFATLAGDYGTRYAANHAKITKDVYAFIAAHARNDKLSEAKYRRMWAKYAELGVSRMGASTSLEGVEGALNLKNPIGRAWERALKIRTMLTDHITKIAGYETYLNNLKKWYKSELRAGTITTEQLETMAADHIRFVYDNRDAMPQWIKKISRNPLVTDYVTFKYSSTRSVINSMREIAVLAQDPHIPKTYIAGRLAKFAAGVLTLGLVAGAELKIAGDAEDELEKLIEKITGLKVRGFGKRIRSKIRTSIATIPAKMSGSDVGSLSETTEDIEKAVRYIGEDYYRNDNQSIFLDDKGNMVRIVWTGSISPFALAVDLPTGFMDAGAIEGINPMDYLKSMRDDVIGGKTMFFDMAETLGKNLSEAYRNSIASSEDVALNQAYDERASDAMQKALIDLANDVFGYYSKVLTSSKTIENYNEWIENKFTEPIEKNGQVVSVPKGYGSKPGLPLDMYKSSRNINNIFMQGIIPVSVRIYTQNDIRQNISLRASAIYKLSSTLNDAQKDVRRNMTSAEKRRYDTMLLDKEVRGWVEHSAVLLRGIGINNVRETQIDALAKAGFKDWQIEHIMKIRR
jgi:hypothetical protein